MGRIMVHMCGLAVLFVLAVAGNGFGGEGTPAPLDSLTGKYEGSMFIHFSKPLEYDYQTEIVSVDKASNTLSLVAHCDKCETRDWKRNHCKITEAKEEIKFTCKGNSADEVYTVKDGALRATGQGKKLPYSISAKKVDKFSY